jgi:hypothetical protein
MCPEDGEAAGSRLVAVSESAVFQKTTELILASVRTSDLIQLI